MPEFADIYIISRKRDQDTVEHFLERFLPNRADAADRYEFPQYSSKPERVFTSSPALIAYCAANSHIAYSIYWKTTGDTKPEHAMVQYLGDGYVIYALSTDADDQPYAGQLLDEMKNFFAVTHGYVGHEASADVGSYREFLMQEKLHCAERTDN